MVKIILLSMGMNIAFSSCGLCQSVLETIKNRESKVSSFRIDFEQVYSKAPKPHSPSEEDLGSRGIQRERWGASQDLPKRKLHPKFPSSELSSSYSVRSDGAMKVRIETWGESWSSIFSKVIQNEKTHVYGATSKKSFHSQPEGVEFNDRPPLGMISSEKKRSWAAENASTWPICFFRYFSEILESHDYEIGKQEFDFEGMSCIKISIKKPATLVETWYLDVDRDYLPVYWEWKADTSTTQFTIEYSEHESGISMVWAPSAWSSVSSRNGKFSSSRKARVTKLELSKPLPPDTFELDFPPRTKVTDHRFKPRKIYFVKEDGKVRNVVRADHTKTNEEIYASELDDKKTNVEVEVSEPVERVRPKPVHRWYWVFLGLVTVAFVFFIVSVSYTHLTLPTKA